MGCLIPKGLDVSVTGPSGISDPLNLRKYEMRDIIKTKKYFEDYIEKSIERHKRAENDLKKGLVKPERIAPFKAFITSQLLSRIKAKYSLGLGVDELYDDLTSVIEIVYQNMKHEIRLIGKTGKILNQYSLDTYDEIIWLLSLGFLLDVPTDKFKKLVDVIDKDQVNDKLFEFIISKKLPSRKKMDSEKQNNNWKLFGTLGEAVESTNKNDIELLVKTFLEKDWYREHKTASWYNNHKNKHGTYSGYWCFESAIIVVIKGIDDFNFRDNEYYPKDLVDYYRANQIT